jgi:hypothetical protein
MRATVFFASLLALVIVSTGCGDGSTTPAGDGGGIDGGGSDANGTTDAGPTDDAPGGDANDPGADSGPAIDGSVDAAVRMPCTAAGACDPFDPTSCPGQACRPTATGTMCSDLSATPVAEHGACARDSDCMPGLACLDFADGLGFVCYQMCPEGSTGACGAGAACTGTFGDVCIQACRPTPAPCDIYAQDCASPTDTCTFVRNPETSDPYTGCRPAGMQAEGDPCGGSAGSCGHGLVCISTAGRNTCHQVCDPDIMPAICPTGEECSGFARTWMVGFCQAPPAP